jgi:hypothetical protein
MTTASNNLSTVDPFDPSRFVIRATDSLMKAEQLLTKISVGKPPKTSFVMASSDPNLTIQVGILELMAERESYLLTPDALCGVDPKLVRMSVLTLSVDRMGNPFLWETRQPDVAGNDTDWAESMRIALSEAKKHWVRVVANMAMGAYDLFVAPGDLSEPEWPKYSMGELLKAGFSGRIIDSPEHPVLLRLRGLA